MNIDIFINNFFIEFFIAISEVSKDSTKLEINFDVSREKNLLCNSAKILSIFFGNIEGNIIIYICY